MVAATCCTGVLHGSGWEFRIDGQLSVFSMTQLAWSLWVWPFVRAKEVSIE